MNDHGPKNLRSAGKWAYAGEFAGRVAQPLVLLALARVLTPDDFGVATMATIVVSFAQVFWEAGLARALVQKELSPQQVDEAATTAVWANLFVSLFLYALVFAVAKPIAQAFGDARAEALIRVQALAIPVMAVSAVLLALFQRELNFRPIFLSRLGAALAPGLVGVPMALTGSGYWALVVGSIAGSLIQAAILFRHTVGRLRIAWSSERIRDLLPFATWSAGEGVLSWSMLWLDTIVIGVALSSHDLGLYRTGSMAVILVFGLAIGALMPVLFSALSRLQTDVAAMHAAFARALKGVALVAMFVAALAFAAPTEVSVLVLGAPWRELGLIVHYLAIMHGIGWLVAPNVELYRAMGRPDINTKVIAGCMLFYVPLLVWAGQRGLETFLIMRLFVGVLGLLVHIVVAWRSVGFSPGRFVRAVGWFVLCGVAAGAAGIFVRNSVGFGHLARALFACGAAAGVFALLSWKERAFLVALVARRSQA